MNLPKLKVGYYWYLDAEVLQLEDRTNPSRWKIVEIFSPAENGDYGFNEPGTIFDYTEKLSQRVPCFIVGPIPLPDFEDPRGTGQGTLYRLIKT